MNIKQITLIQMAASRYQLSGDYQAGTPCEVTGIVETVEKKSKVGGKWTDLSFVVVAPRSGTRFDCIYSGFALIAAEDRIYMTGFKSKTSDPKRFNLTVNNQPIIEPGATRSAIINVITQAFPKRSKLTAIRADDIFEAIEKATREDDGCEEDRVILHLANESNKVEKGRYDVKSSPLYGLIEDETILELYRYWYKNREKRKLQMLGLMPDEIDALPWPSHIAYEKLRCNPYTVPFLTLERCRDMMKSIKKVPTAEQVRRGEILREIYQALMKRCWSYYPHRFLYENFPDLSEHIEALTADRDPEGNTPYGYGLHNDEDRGGLYLKYVYEIEDGVADMLAKRVKEHDARAEAKFIVEPIYKMKTLTDDQKKAIDGILNNPVTCLTGGPGTGKSTCISEILLNYQAHNIDYVVASFTGKAVQRVKEILKNNAFSEDVIELNVCTLHRACYKGLSKDKVSHLIIDETSMVTTELFHKFLSIYPDIKFICFVGDYNQLLPIGWGSLFKEIIFSERFPVYRLYVNHRTRKVDGDIDGITYNAERMILSNKNNPFSFTEYNNFRIKSGNINTVETLVKRIVETQNIKDNEIVVLTPRNIDKDSLNKSLSTFFRPKAQSLVDSKGTKWRIGDLVIATENIYGSVNIMNGTPGRIIEFHIGNGKFGSSNKKLRISFDDYSVKNWDPKVDITKFRKRSFFFDTVAPKRVPYGGKENEKVEDNKVLHVGMVSQAAALTGHKSQGSEWPYVIVYIPEDLKASKGFLNRNWIYTSITRSKNMCILIGDIETFDLAANTKPAYRAEALAIRLGCKLDRVYKKPSIYSDDPEGDDFDDGEDAGGDDDVDDDFDGDPYSDEDCWDDVDGDYPSEDDDCD
jgi:hypothetical protein